MDSKILVSADLAVSTERQGIYGHPAENFKNIATMWEGYKGVPFTTADVAMMMILVKVARYKNTPGHIDTLVDIAGYVKTEEMILDRNSNLANDGPLKLNPDYHHYWTGFNAAIDTCARCDVRFHGSIKYELCPSLIKRHEKSPVETGRFDSSSPNPSGRP